MVEPNAAQRTAAVDELVRSVQSAGLQCVRVPRAYGLPIACAGSCGGPGAFRVLGEWWGCQLSTGPESAMRGRLQCIVVCAEGASCDVIVNDRVSTIVDPGSYGGGGGFSWHFNFAWESLRFKLTTKFPTRNSGFSPNFSHTSGTHCGLWRVIHLTGGPAKFPTAKFNTAQHLARNFPPSRNVSAGGACCGVVGTASGFLASLPFRSQVCDSRESAAAISPGKCRGVALCPLVGAQVLQFGRHVPV